MLGDDNPRWRPDRYGYELWGVRTELQSPIVKLLDYAERRAELEQSENPFATVVLAHLDTLLTRQDQNDRKDRKFRLTRRLLQRGWTENRVRQLYRLIDWMMDLPRELEQSYWNDLMKFKEESYMPYVATIERYARAEALEEGIKKGLTHAIEAASKTNLASRPWRLMPEIAPSTTASGWN